MNMAIKIYGCVILCSIFFASAPLVGAEETVRDVFRTNIPSPGSNRPVPLGQTPVVQTILQGIGMGHQGAFAIISGQIYHEGEEKQGIKVAQIRKQEVDIIVNGVASTLRMVPPPVSPAEGGPSEGRRPFGPEIGGGMVPQREVSEKSSAPEGSESGGGPVGLDRISKAPIGLMPGEGELVSNESEK